MNCVIKFRKTRMNKYMLNVHLSSCGASVTQCRPIRLFFVVLTLCRRKKKVKTLVAIRVK